MIMMIMMMIMMMMLVMMIIDHDHDHDHDGGDDGDAGDDDDGDDDDDDDDDDDGGDGGGGNERASNLFLRANQPSSEAFSHQNRTTPNLCQKQIKSRILRVSNTERRRQESIEHLTLLLSRLNCSTLTMIGWTVL